MQTQVSKFVTSDLGLVNSYDTWHGMSIYLKMYSSQQCGNRIKECCKAIEEDFSGSGEEPWGFLICLTKVRRMVLTFKFTYVVHILWCALIRKRHQDTPLLVHEELWSFCGYTACPHPMHSKALYGK